MIEETHTSDRVLETKIEGLSKLNEEKFKNTDESLKRLEGKIDKIVDAGYVTKDEHNKHKEEFAEQLEKTIKQVQFNSKMIWVATGIVGTISFFSPLVFKYLFNL